MTTRASTARGQDKQQFQGRVRNWRKQWDLASDTAKYKLLKWVPTDERTEDRAFSRFPNLRPILSEFPQHQKFSPLLVPSGSGQELAVNSELELSKLSAAPQSLPNSIDTTVAARSSSVHPNGILPDPANTPLLDAPAQPANQLHPMDLSSAAMRDAR